MTEIENHKIEKKYQHHDFRFLFHNFILQCIEVIQNRFINNDYTILELQNNFDRE